MPSVVCVRHIGNVTHELLFNEVFDQVVACAGR